MPVSTTTISGDFKNVYGEGLKNQIGQAAVIFNLFKDGKQFAKPITTIGANGYTFGCRLKRNYQLGYRPEGTTGVATSGNQGVQQGTVVLKYAYIPHVLTGQATNLSVGQYRAFMAAKALELEYDTKDLLEHINVVVAGAERGGQLAQALNTSATVIASRAGGLPGALYLQVGMPVSAGPVGGGTLTTGSTDPANIITAISYDAVAGDTVTLTTADSLTSGDAIYLGGEASPTTGAFPYTAEGFHSLIAATGSRQGLNPATAGQEAWTSYAANAGGVDLTSQTMDELIQFVENRGGETVDCLFFPSAQINQLVNLGTKELRYNVDNPNGIGKRALDLGFTTYTYGGRTIIKDKHIRNDRIWAMNSDCMAHFVAIPLSMADDEAGQWTRVIGSSASIAAAIASLMRLYHQIGILQRSAAGYVNNLSVPIAFQINPQSLN